MSTLADRMNDFRPRTIGHADLPSEIGLAGDTITAQALDLAPQVTDTGMTITGQMTDGGALAAQLANRGYELSPRSGMISLDLPPGIITPVPGGVSDPVTITEQMLAGEP